MPGAKDARAVPDANEKLEGPCILLATGLS
jgi:hypothetical protein